VELTSRANVQVRGLAADDGDAVAARLAAGGLLPSPAHDRVRNVLAGPVAGRHPDAVADVDGLTAALDAGLCADLALADLPGRFLFAVDDGSATHGAQVADVALVAEAPARFRVVLAGVETTLVAADRDDAVALALDAARAFLALRDDDGHDAWRIADLAEGVDRVAEDLGGRRIPTAGPPRPGRDLPVGRLTQRDGRTAVTVLPPLGRLDGGTVRALARLADEHGTDVRVAPGRTLTFVDVTPHAVDALATRLAERGLIVTPGSPWPGLSACAGLGGCARARADVRSVAVRRAAVRDPAAPPEHWTACERGCGRPADAAVAVCATADGARVERDGETHPVADLDAALALLDPGSPNR
jgi:sulfite reductase beta subunit-like hemoprotein